MSATTGVHKRLCSPIARVHVFEFELRIVSGALVRRCPMLGEPRGTAMGSPAVGAAAPRDLPKLPLRARYPAPAHR